MMCHHLKFSLSSILLHFVFRYTADFYGFSNGDILFNDGLKSTLQGVKNYFSVLGPSLVVGQRKNYYMSHQKNTTMDLYKKEIVTEIGRTDAHYFTLDAEDFFFLSHHGFQWDLVKDIVIGRPGYDNYFVYVTRTNNVSLIDATHTLLALHQTGADGKFAGIMTS